VNARFADLTLAEAAQRLRRYRPLVLTVVLTLGILRALPEQDSGVEEAQQPTAPAAAISPSAGAPVSDATPDPPSSPGVESVSSVPHPSFPAPIAPTGSSATTTSTAITAAPSTPSPSPSPSPSPEPPESTAPTVLYTGWATRAADTPAGTIGVPDGSLPVGNRLGQTDKVSFVRLGGDWQTLAVRVDPDGTAGVGEPSVRACAITTASWEPRSGAGFEDAPTWGDDCVAGVADAAGETWSFEVGQIDHRFGVALVPAPDAPVEFQIAFRTPG
jgi:hypothetical protein